MLSIKNILFIGNFLSKQRGTINPTEYLIEHLSNSGYKIDTASSYENLFLRIFEMVFKTMFFKYDAVHIDIFSGKYFTCVDIVSKLASIRKKRIFMTLHGGMLAEFYKDKPDRVGDTLKRADLVLSPSIYLASFFEKVLCIKVRYHPNFINIKNFSYGRTKVKTHSLLWVRAFDPIYNPDIAVLALSEVRRKYPDATLTMVGPDKGLLPDVQKLIKELGLQEVVDIVGPVQNNELYKYYQTHEVFLNTTSFESFGQAVMEAAACGIPIVSTNVGEIPFLWENEKEMIIVDEPDPKLFAYVIIRILSDQEFARNMTINARKKAEKFDWISIKEKWMDILTNL